MKSERQELVIQLKRSTEAFIGGDAKIEGWFPIEQKAQKLEKACYIFGQSVSLECRMLGGRVDRDGLIR